MNVIVTGSPALRAGINFSGTSSPGRVMVGLRVGWEALFRGVGVDVAGVVPSVEVSPDSKLVGDA